MLAAMEPMGDFDFNSTYSTPYASAPSSPKRFGNFGASDFYFSAPSSPSHSSTIYNDFNTFSSSLSNHNRLAGDDEDENEDEDADFAFDFHGKFETASVSADELFQGGKIKPLSIPTTRASQRSPVSSPRSPATRQGKKIHPFKGEQTTTQVGERGRTLVPSSSRSHRRESRSLSPLRVAEFAWEQEAQQQQIAKEAKPTSSSSSSSSSLKGSRKWSFRDFLLFRSASEGRASEKDPLRKFTALPRRSEDEKNSSFRSVENQNQTGGSTSKRRGPVSAHELHYKVNRAVAEESKRKTYLPYKPRLLGFLGFNPSIHSQRH